MADLRVRRRRGRPRARSNVVLADKAYSSRTIREHLRKGGIRAVTSVPADQRSHRLRRGSRGGRPPVFDERHTSSATPSNGASTVGSNDAAASRYDKTATIYLAGLRIAGIFMWSARWTRRWSDADREEIGLEAGCPLILVERVVVDDEALRLVGEARQESRLADPPLGLGMGGVDAEQLDVVTVPLADEHALAIKGQGARPTPASFRCPMCHSREAITSTSYLRAPSGPAAIRSLHLGHAPPRSERELLATARAGPGACGDRGLAHPPRLAPNNSCLRAMSSVRGK